VNPLAGLLSKSNETGSAPKAYLNYLVFDRDYNLLDGGFVRMTESAKESGTDVPHELLSKELVIKKPGYVYIYLSNDNVALGGSQVEVYFDDFNVEYTKSPVIQADEYYPFGLTFNSYRRENSVSQKYSFNGMERLDDLNLNVYNTFYRNFDPMVGRWWGIDPKPNEMFSPYAAMGNNPLLYSDPLGDTTMIYSMQGKLLKTINDSHENQAHFVKSLAKQGKEESVDDYATRLRAKSTAFIGSNTISDMEKIVSFSTKLNKEVGFVGEISKTREIRLTKLPTDENNSFNSVALGAQLDKHFSSATQGILFFAGHVHHGGLSNASDMDKAAKELAVPTIGLIDNRPYDYYYNLRNAEGDLRPSPGIIATPFGMTIYPTIPNKVYSYPNVEDNSTINFKFFKK
jgi:RHS repeat-associated protein